MKVLATWFYTGTIPGAPGTWGSLATLPFAYLLHWLGGPIALVVATVLLCPIGWWVTHQYLLTKHSSQEDPQEVVIDEVVGQMIALWPLSVGLHAMTNAMPHVVPWPGWVGAFVLFRFFDITKPWPVNKLEKLPGATGVMADDIMAGFLAALVLMMTAVVAHGIFV